MSFIQAGRTLSRVRMRRDEGTPFSRLADRVEQIERILVDVETWMNDIFRVINANAGSGLVVDNYTDLPPATEAAGRIYYVVNGDGGAPVKYFHGSDATNWLPLD